MLFNHILFQADWLTVIAVRKLFDIKGQAEWIGSQVGPLKEQVM